MRVIVNGENMEVPESTTISALLLQFGIDPSRKGLAVAVDGEIVPRELWPETRLEEGCGIDVVHAVRGG